MLEAEFFFYVTGLVFCFISEPIYFKLANDFYISRLNRSLDWCFMLKSEMSTFEEGLGICI